MQQLTTLYTTFTGSAPQSVETLTGSGSNRQYVRFTAADGHSLIGVVGTSVEENQAFVYLSQHFASKGLAVPHVVAVSADRMRYLQDDLGSRSLFDALRSGREAGGHYGEAERLLLRRTIAELPRLQILGGQGLDFSKCYPQPAMDETSVMFDLNYFKYCYLKAVGIDFHELRLEDDFRALAQDLLAGEEDASTFLYRDFQSRNVMLDSADRPYFIDFQGGRRGPLQYDLASFLWQASARYPQSLREELIDVYLESLERVKNGQSTMDNGQWTMDNGQWTMDNGQWTMDIGADTQGDNQLEGIVHRPLSIVHSSDHSSFVIRLRRFVLFRLLQVLGAYGFRGYFERKQHFLDSIPPALQNVRALLSEEGSCPYPELRRVLEKILASDLTSQRMKSEESRFARSEESPFARSEESKEASSLESKSHSSLFTLHSSLSPQRGAEDEALLPSLTVRVFSFSYKKGIPEDTSGNGGGYVFDCRSTHNPGRYEPYKQLTGLDAPVIKFLEDDGEILTFLESVYRLADAHVERYLQRGFTDLMFSFGCTGGQHRSVYCAQHLAEHLHRKYGIVVELTHREQGLSTKFPKQ